MSDLKKADWHRQQVDDGAIVRAQAFQATRDTIASKDRLTDETWAGPLAEEVFDRWLTDRGIDHEWDHDPHEFDRWDFYVPPWYIDVKCGNCTSEPHLDYACNLKKRQARNVAVSAYVHARYNSQLRELILFGAISKVDFLAEAMFRKKGEVLPQANGQSMTVKHDFYEQEISILTPLDAFLAGPECRLCGERPGYMDGQLCGGCWLGRRKALLEAEAIVV